MSGDDEPFGIRVLVPGDRPYPLRSYQVGPAEYGLILPHQCDDWLIAADPDVSKVISAAVRFRRELDEAIGKLQQAREAT